MAAAPACLALAGLVSFCAFLLGACSTREPTEAEMLETLRDFGPTKMLLADAATMKAGARKTGCESVARDTFRCGIAPKEGRGLVLKYLFTRVDGTWQIAR